MIACTVSSGLRTVPTSTLTFRTTDPRSIVVLNIFMCFQLEQNVPKEDFRSLIMYIYKTLVAITVVTLLFYLLNLLTSL